MNQNKTIKPISAILIGAGARGWHAYGDWGLKNRDKINFVAVAEPVKKRRLGFSRDWNISDDYQFETWEDLLSEKIGKIADVCLVCTQDQMHTQPTLKALKLGYDVLLEKPMAITKEECVLLVKTSEETNQQLRICHVLRYTTMFSKIKKAIKDGLIGQIINIQHSENVSYWHFPHAYVRGHWRKKEESSPVIIAKSCHDLDILYWLVESISKYIQSFGTLKYYNEINKPEGVPERCTDGCPIAEDCPWYAPRLYVEAKPIIRVTQRSKKKRLKFLGNLLLNHRKFMKLLSYIVSPLKNILNWKYWPATVITEDLSVKGKMDALKKGPYGRCVYQSDNNVPDNQTVNIQFNNGTTATMTMHGHSFLDGRWIRISGSKGSLLGKFTYGGEKLIYYDHRYVNETILWESDISFQAHSDGDAGLMESFVRSVANGKTNENSLTSARSSLESHLMGFAAEKSRIEKNVIDMDKFRA